MLQDLQAWPVKEWAANSQRAHASASCSLILKAHAIAKTRSILVLGCGRCSEIPAAQLLETSEVDFADIDSAALEATRETLGFSDGDARRARFLNIDLTGTVKHAREWATRWEPGSLATTEAVDACIQFLDDVKTPLWHPGQTYGLVICSLVLTQLQASVIGAIEGTLRCRFPEWGSQLKGDPRWNEAKFRFARRLEEDFIRNLAGFVGARGLIYFSDTVRVSFFRASPLGSATSPGSWTTTKTNRLADYFACAFRVLEEQSWHWALPKRDAGWDGRLYDVQALLLQLAAPEGAALCCNA